jgi:SAM-dependent methyltransferase
MLIERFGGRVPGTMEELLLLSGVGRKTANLVLIPSEPDPRWEAFAAAEPYFAVLAAPQFLRRNLTAERRREFFAGGETLVESMLRVVELRLAPEFAPPSILEYGCGVGRLAIPLARRADRVGGSVMAVDRSPAMLAIAREEAERQGVKNIEFRTPAELFSGHQGFDFISCYLVLQRLAPHDGLSLLGTLIDRLAPEGIGVFHVPFKTTDSPFVRATRWVRQRVPITNIAANAVRGRPLRDPFVSAATYDLAEVFGTLEDRSIDATHVVFDRHERLDTALLFVAVPPRPPTAARGPDHATPSESAPVDVADLIAGTSIEELNQAAEEYFASLTSWEHQLTKPFSHVHETPPLLVDVATLLRGLRLAPGSTVLEFGAGTGWLSRFLTQLGCRVILLDVSPTALKIARELYARLPIIGNRPEPEFLTFDGRHIELPDRSVDRIVCFHAFHHAPDPAAIVREFGRVLVPGGIAGFAEPGPRHSRSPLAQFEMRNYKVVENDIDVNEIGRIAGAAGFRDMQLAVFHTPPFHVSLREYEDFLAGGATTERWVRSTRLFLTNSRTFFLIKEGHERPDSRTIDGLKCEIHATLASPPVREGHPIAIDAIVTNTGGATWLPLDAGIGAVGCGVHLYDEAGRLLQFEFPVTPLTDPLREVNPGETVRCTVSLPPRSAGRYIVELDCVAAHVSWFAQLGSRPARVTADVGPSGVNPAKAGSHRARSPSL